MRLPFMAAVWLAATPALAQDPAGAEDPSATTLETLTVRPEPEEVVDLYRFRNPIEVEPGTFERSWREPTSLEQLGKNGGIVPVPVAVPGPAGATGATGAAGIGQRRVRRPQ